MAISEVLDYHTRRAKRSAKDLIRIRANKHIYTGIDLGTWYQVRRDCIKQLYTHNRYKRILKEAIHERLQ